MIIEMKSWTPAAATITGPTVVSKADRAKARRAEAASRQALAEKAAKVDARWYTQEVEAFFGIDSANVGQDACKAFIDRWNREHNGMYLMLDKRDPDGHKRARWEFIYIAANEAAKQGKDAVLIDVD